MKHVAGTPKLNREMERELIVLICNQFAKI